MGLFVDIVAELRANSHLFSSPVRQLYETESTKKLKQRVREKFQRMMANRMKETDAELRSALEAIAKRETSQVFSSQNSERDRLPEISTFFPSSPVTCASGNHRNESSTLQTPWYSPMRTPSENSLPSLPSTYSTPVSQNPSPPIPFSARTSATSTSVSRLSVPVVSSGIQHASFLHPLPVLNSRSLAAQRPSSPNLQPRRPPLLLFRNSIINPRQSIVNPSQSPISLSHLPQVQGSSHRFFDPRPSHSPVSCIPNRLPNIRMSNPTTASSSGPRQSVSGLGHYQPSPTFQRPPVTTSSYRSPVPGGSSDRDPCIASSYNSTVPTVSHHLSAPRSARSSDSAPSQRASVSRSISRSSVSRPSHRPVEVSSSQPSTSINSTNREPGRLNFNDRVRRHLNDIAANNNATATNNSNDVEDDPRIEVARRLARNIEMPRRRASTRDMVRKNEKLKNKLLKYFWKNRSDIFGVSGSDDSDSSD